MSELKPEEVLRGLYEIKENLVAAICDRKAANRAMKYIDTLRHTVSELHRENERLRKIVDELPGEEEIETIIWQKLGMIDGTEPVAKAISERIGSEA